MYVVYIKDYIHHLLNEYKMSIFVYNSDQRIYIEQNIKIKDIKQKKSGNKYPNENKRLY